MNALLAGAEPTWPAPAVAAVAQVVAQPAAELPPEPDFNTAWTLACRQTANGDRHTEAEKQWLRELTGRQPKGNVTSLGSPAAGSVF